LLRIATWNVNSVKARIVNLLHWLAQAQPDVVMIQEIKVSTADFPRLEIEDLGYNVAVVGQKTYNGVALLSKHPMTVEETRLPGDESDEQARYIEALIEATATKGGKRTVLRAVSVYVPNGNPVESDKFPYKLAWLDRLHERMAEILTFEEIAVIGGDYNVIPTDEDVYDPVAWRADALGRPESRAKFRKLLHLGYTDALRALHPEPHLYSFWDYQAGRWPRDEGLRIDHLLLSPQAADRLRASGVDREPRGRDKPSDHTPVWCELDA
jgi:exodeoxyribonuclease-3